MDLSVLGTVDQKMFLIKLKGGFSTLSPLDPPMLIFMLRFPLVGKSSSLQVKFV